MSILVIGDHGPSCTVMVQANRLITSNKKAQTLEEKNEDQLARMAFKMKLRPGCKEEYIKRHQAIWPALAALLKANGVNDYSIFLDEESNTLFAVQKVGGAAGSQELGSHEIVQAWWKYMADIMETNADNSPVTTRLEEVFYLR
jgi:L-rhamnose mutarotase